MKLDISNTMLLSWETEMQSKEVEFIVVFFFSGGDTFTYSSMSISRMIGVKLYI